MKPAVLPDMAHVWGGGIGSRHTTAHNATAAHLRAVTFPKVTCFSSYPRGLQLSLALSNESNVMVHPACHTMRSV